MTVRKFRQEVLVIVGLMLGIFMACAMTPMQKQLMTLDTFNGIYRQYLDEYDRQPASVKENWKEQIDPYWKEASLAMNAYMAVSDPDSTEAQKKLAIYSAAKNQALKLLLKYGVEIKEDK